MTCVNIPTPNRPICPLAGTKLAYDSANNTRKCIGDTWQVLSAPKDLYWDGTATGNIWKKSWFGNVWVGLTNPNYTLTVKDSFEVRGWGSFSYRKLYCPAIGEDVLEGDWSEAKCRLCSAGTFDPSSGKCLTTECPSGYTYNSSSKVCEQLTCPSGYTYNSSTNKCDLIATPVDGVCGSANGSTVPTAPTSNLCFAGTASAVGGSGPWSWSCVGINSGSTASCNANKIATPVDGYCNTSTTSKIRENKPAVYQQCYAWSPGPIWWTNPRTWSCYGQYGGTNASCSTMPLTYHRDTWERFPCINDYRSRPVYCVDNFFRIDWTESNCDINTRPIDEESCVSPINGSCNAVTTSNVRNTQPPKDDLCYWWTPGLVSWFNPYTWTCIWANGWTNMSCSTKVWTNYCYVTERMIENWIWYFDSYDASILRNLMTPQQQSNANSCAVSNWVDSEYEWVTSYVCDSILDCPSSLATGGPYYTINDYSPGGGVCWNKVRGYVSSCK